MTIILNFWVKHVFGGGARDGGRYLRYYALAAKMVFVGLTFLFFLGGVKHKFGGQLTQTPVATRVVSDST